MKFPWIQTSSKNYDSGNLHSIDTVKLLLLQSGVYQTSIVWYRPESVAADKAMMEILYGFKPQ